MHKTIHMKKLVLSIFALCSVAQITAQNGQIPNGGFENWSNTTLYDYTTMWKCSNQDQFSGVATAYKSTDAQLGTYSAEIRSVALGPNPDTLFGYVLHGSVGSSGPDGGIPYTSVFNTVKFQYKCDLPVANDSVFLYVIRFISGAPVEFVMQPVIGGTHSTWTQGSALITSNPQEELFIGFVMGDPMNNVYCAPGSWARIDNVQMFNGAMPVTNLPDPSFESWAEETVENPDNWSTLNNVLSGMALANSNKTTDAYTGTYAIELTTVFESNSSNTFPGIISWGPLDLNNMSNPFLPAPYNANPTIFSGAYKYSSVSVEDANIQINFLQGGTVIGTHTQPFYGASQYVTFSSPISISGTPDSIVFVAFSGSEVGSTLKLDDLSFSGGNVGIDEFEKFSISVYPNPATDIVMIKSEGIYSFEIIDLTGKVVRSEANLMGTQTIDVRTISKGAYLVKLNNASGIKIHQLVIE